MLYGILNEFDDSFWVEFVAEAKAEISAMVFDADMFDFPRKAKA